MAVSIAAVMRRVRNFFEREKIEGTFAISGGMLTPSPNAPYWAISGSARYDGVWPEKQLPIDRENETFEGVVWGLHPPEDFLQLCEEIQAYDQKNPMGALQSETFADYSYTRASAGSSAGGGWESAFEARLIPYRRMFTEVRA